MNLPIAHIDALFAAWDRPDSPGCALGIVHAGELVYARGYGMADLEHGVPITPATVFDIASISKQFTAWCVLALAEEGQLSLDDPIQRFCPEVPEYGQRITLHHLLHHTSGLRDYLGIWPVAGLPDANVFRREDVYATIARQRELNFAPGSDYIYSNTGYWLLGEVVQRVSGQTLREFAHEQVFAPLGMASTHFHDDFTEIEPNRALGHALRGDGSLRLDLSFCDLVGDGGIYTTVEDLARWDAVFYASPLAGGDALIAQMHVPGRLVDGSAISYARGLVIGAYRGARTVSHGGSWAGYRSSLLRFPDERFTVICLANLASMEPWKLAHQVADLCLGSRLGPATNIPGGAPVAVGDAAFAGVYRNTAWDEPLTLSWQAEGLHLTAPWYGFDGVLAAAGEGAYAIAGETDLRVEFEPGSADDPPAAVIHIEGEPPRRYARIATGPAEAVPTEEYVGTYASAEANTVYHVRVADGHLWVQRPGAPDSPLTSLDADLFSLDDWGLRFARNAAGMVDSFALTAEGAFRLNFTRVAGGGAA
ncbi:MAG: beta-lactamase family protein [Caldilinea sp.]|nr:beta-lactamase family protein [Caldilinea sp.]